jgi:TRAP-type C4-dicarboxylate transport system substrate-binding protein
MDSWRPDTDRREETSTLRDLLRGRADLAWVGARAFGCLGVRSLDPLQAPLLLADYPAVAAALSEHDLAAEMMAPLETLGLVGLTLLPGALRKPFAFERALLTVRDYERLRFRIHESRVENAVALALDTAVVLLSAREMAKQPQAGADAMFIHAGALRSWRHPGYVVWNVNLWPRLVAIVSTGRTLDRIGTEGHDLLRAAAAATLATELAALDSQEARDDALVPEDVSVVYADEGGLLDLRHRLEPVYEEIRRDPNMARSLQRLEDVVARSRSAEL